MKKSLTSVCLLAAVAILAVAGFPNMQAQTQPATKAIKPVKVYKIQLGAFQNPKLGNFEKLYDLGGIYSEPTGKKGVTRVLMGDFKTEGEAKEALAKVKERGFADAFISGETLAADAGPAKPAVEEKKSEEQNVSDEGGEKKHQIEEMSDKSGATGAGAKNGTGEVAAKPATHDAYLVQLGAFKNPNYDSFVEAATVGDIYAETVDGITRITIGTFNSKELAKKAQARLKAMGFVNAYVRKIDATTKKN